MTKPTVFTIGHSNHSIDQFCRLLLDHGIEAIADVRSYPQSRWSPQFNRLQLCKSLEANDVQYVYLGTALGGHDPKSDVDSKPDYESRVATHEFAAGIMALSSLAKRCRVAVMCAEKDPIACHRTLLVGRRLLEMQFNLVHILSNGTLESQESLVGRQSRARNKPRADLFDYLSGD